MAGGRPPTPTGKLSLYGGLRTDRHASRAREPMPAGTPDMFIQLDGEALRCWEFVLPKLMEMGVAGEADSLQICAMCEWWAKYQKYKTAFEENEYRRLNMEVTAYKQFHSIATKYGLTARDRVGLEGATQTPDDELSELIA